MASNDKFQFTAEAATIVNILEDHTESMKEHEADFVTDMSERLDKYGDECFVSEKQISWLRSLQERYT